MTSNGTYNFEYDAKNRLIKVTRVSDESAVAEYIYDSSGRRIAKKVNGETINYTYNDISKMLLSETNEEGSLLRSYITETDEYGKLISLTVKDTSGGRKTYYYLYNGTGEIVGLVDEEGNIVVKYSYDSWGVPTEYQYNQTTGTWEEVPVGTFTNPYLYKSYYYDTETGLTT